MFAKALEIEKLYVNFNEFNILKDINLTVNEKDFLAIIGPNGGGKSTLLKTILNLIKPDKGKIHIFGKIPKESLDIMGYLPQNAHFDMNFPINVFDVVLMGRYNGLLKNYNKNDKKAVINALNDVSMLEFKDRQISRLSGGQMQRIFIARALAREPKILLLDEPTASVDPKMQKSFYELLLKLKEKMTIILVTHDVGVVCEYVDKIACLNQRLFYHGTPEGSADAIQKTYNCPIDIIGHGVPHRVFKKHE
ncbi:MAG: ABC transporter ATP-binding protein [Methanobacterium sp.]|nr:ABC transporter ATP-binding protein [Methanobacterium sp.]